MSESPLLFRPDTEGNIPQCPWYCLVSEIRIVINRQLLKIHRWSLVKYAILIARQLQETDIQSRPWWKAPVERDPFSYVCTKMHQAVPNKLVAHDYCSSSYEMRYYAFSLYIDTERRYCLISDVEWFVVCETASLTVESINSRQYWNRLQRRRYSDVDFSSSDASKRYPLLEWPQWISFVTWNRSG